MQIVVADDVVAHKMNLDAAVARQDKYAVKPAKNYKEGSLKFNERGYQLLKPKKGKVIRTKRSYGNGGHVGFEPRAEVVQPEDSRQVARAKLRFQSSKIPNDIAKMRHANRKAMMYYV